MYELYKQAKELLWQEYKKNFQIVKDSDFHRAYVNEKIRHSLQVSGAGNGILRHEAFFQNRSAEFLDICRCAVILHDIFRFNEVRRWFLSNEKSDHGVEGADMLKHLPPFDDIRITLPVKHHGHLVEKFYQDEEYIALKDPALKRDIEHIHFAVRDADKIANWQILTGEFEAMRPVWLPYPQDMSSAQSKITPEAWASFLDRETVPLKFILTNADMLLSILSWLFDVNYSYSVFYCRRLNLFNKFYKLFEIIGVDKDKCEQIKNTVREYLADRFQVSDLKC